MERTGNTVYCSYINADRPEQADVLKEGPSAWIESGNPINRLEAAAELLGYSPDDSMMFRVNGNKLEQVFQKVGGRARFRLFVWTVVKPGERFWQGNTR